ncbi:MAG: helix-hairpin-helix domain-containing protein [candidate division WOR-3 bacterium]
MVSFGLILYLFLLGTHKIDINSARLEELLNALPIDSTKVIRIYNYRETFGPFNNIYELARLPFISAADLKVLKERVMFSRKERDIYFSYYTQDVRERTVTEESPMESAYDYWLTALRTPINVNKASIDELYSIYGVSLIDAAQVYKRARMLGFQRASHLRRTPGLSYYGYRNLLPYVGFRDYRPVPFTGWLTLNLSHHSELYQEETSDIESRIEQLTTVVTDTAANLWTSLNAAGWTTEDSIWLYTQLRTESEEASRLKPKPYIRLKFNSSLWGKARIGFSLYDNPYISRAEPKYFLGIEKITLPLGIELSKAILGHYRITLDQGLFLDNSDEGRSRLLDRVFGLYGDLSRYDAFAFYGGAIEGLKGPLKLTIWHSYLSKNGIDDKDGNLVFYYDGDFIPSTFRNKFYEKVQGFNIKYEIIPKLPGTQIGFSGMRIIYSRPMLANFQSLDIPFDREDFSDPVFNWIGGKEKRFFQVSGRTVLYPFSIEVEYAKELKGGDAFVARGRIQQSILTLNVLYRDYDVNYTNPYSRPFYEDTRFRYTILTRSYRLIDPLYANLGNLPFPKPEQGIYVELRYQPFARLLLPRVYVDLWRDKSDFQNNRRAQFQVEYRIINQFRIRYTYRNQVKANPRYLGVSQSDLNEHSFQFMIPFGGTFFTAEYRNTVMRLTERGIDFRTSIYGQFLSFYIDIDMAQNISLKAGAVVWATNGYSLWHFEDVGIDFLYGDGTKWFISFVHQISSKVGIRLKFREKLTQYPHTGIEGRGIVNSEGQIIYLPFIDERRVFTLQLSLDYAF